MAGVMIVQLLFGDAELVFRSEYTCMLLMLLLPSFQQASVQAAESIPEIKKVFMMMRKPMGSYFLNKMAFL